MMDPVLRSHGDPQGHVYLHRGAPQDQTATLFTIAIAMQRNIDLELLMVRCKRVASLPQAGRLFKLSYLRDSEST